MAHTQFLAPCWALFMIGWTQTDGLMGLLLSRIQNVYNMSNQFPFIKILTSHWHQFHRLGSELVMCWLQPEARGWAKPSQARPDLWPETAFGQAWILSKPEPAAWKAGSKIVRDVLKLSFNYFFWYCTVKKKKKKVQLIPILPRCRVQGLMPTTSFLLI